MGGWDDHAQPLDQHEPQRCGHPLLAALGTPPMARANSVCMNNKAPQSASSALCCGCEQQQLLHHGHSLHLWSQEQAESTACIARLSELKCVFL